MVRIVSIDCQTVVDDPNKIRTSFADSLHLLLMCSLINLSLRIRYLHHQQKGQKGRSIEQRKSFLDLTSISIQYEFPFDDKWDFKKKKNQSMCCHQTIRPWHINFEEKNRMNSSINVAPQVYNIILFILFLIVIWSWHF